MNRAALYLRVSTERQTVANQRPELVRLAKQRGLSIVRTYEEQESAVKNRPQYDAMISDAHRGAFDVVIVWSLDRFGRSALGNLQAVLDLDAKKVRLVNARESWVDTEGPVRQLLIYVLSWVAEQERRRLIERTKAGIERARKEGKALGRPKTIHSTISVMALLRGRDATVQSVARQLGCSESSIHRARRSYLATYGDVPPELAGVSKGGPRKGGPKSAKSRPRGAAVENDRF